MYNYEIKPSLRDILRKLSKKDNILYKFTLKKIEEIINSESIEHYKNLRHNMKDYKRVHIGHFVLIFSYNEKFNLISFEDFEHHDKIYQIK